MKEIRAYIQPYMLNKVVSALMDIPGFPGMTVSDCEGFSRESLEIKQEYKLFTLKKRIEIFSPDHLVDTIFQILMKAAHTGHHGDGKIYVIETAYGGYVSTGEIGDELV